MEIEKVKEIANKMLESKNFEQSTKEGICSLLEELLHSEDQYQGFTFLEPGYKEATPFSRRYL